MTRLGDPAPPPPAVPPFARARLGGMMFLLFFGFGSWGPTFPTYQMAAPPAGLGFATPQVGWVSSTFALGGLAAPLLVGLLADRLFRAERVLACSAFAAAGLIAAAGLWCDGSTLGFALQHKSGGPDDAEDVRRLAAAFGPLFCVMLAAGFSLQLGLTLTTVIALRNLPNPGDFGRTRLWGTVGWIAAGNAVGVALVGVSTQPLYLGATAFALLGLYALTLPATPPAARNDPTAAGWRGVAQKFGLPALRLFRRRSFAVYVGVTFVAVGLNQFYAVYAHRFLTDHGIVPAEQALTLGQVCEVGCLFLIPLLHPRRHLKLLLLVGLGGWVVRAACLGFGDDALIRYVGVPMHGWSFAFFQVVGTVYLDREAPPHLRASAQGVLTFVSGGLANLVGNLVAGAVIDAHRTGPMTDWQAVWTVPLVGCTAAFITFAFLFRTPPDPTARP